MVLYTFRCESDCGITRQMYSMGSCPDVVDCPKCSGRARKMLSVPHLGRTGVAMALQDATRATADHPEVVSTPPPRTRRQRTSVNPRHRKLPRS